MIVEGVKALVLVGLLLMTFALGMIPVLIVKVFKRSSENLHRQLIYKRSLSLMSCFAAGVFLATCLLDLLPTVRVNLGTVLNDLEVFTSFPLAEFVMMFGLFIILIVEQIALSVKEKHMVEQKEREPLLRDNNRQSNREVIRSNSMGSEHSISGISDEPYGVRFSSSYPGTCRELSQGHVTANRSLSDNENEGQDDLDEAEKTYNIPEHNHSSLRTLMLLIALSLHSVFEGLAVGLQKSADDVLGIFAALVLHKSILSFSLGMNLIQSKLTNAGVIRSILFFSVTAPFGVAVGIGITDLWDSSISNLFQGLLSGIACGTFLYVTFFEVLPCEFNSQDQRLLKVIMLLIGFGTVTGILFLHKGDEPTCYVKPPTLKGAD